MCGSLGDEWLPGMLLTEWQSWHHHHHVTIITTATIRKHHPHSAPSKDPHAV